MLKEEEKKMDLSKASRSLVVQNVIYVYTFIVRVGTKRCKNLNSFVKKKKKICQDDTLYFGKNNQLSD